MLDNLLSKISDSEVVRFLIVELGKTQEKSSKRDILYLLQDTKHCITKKQKQQLRELLIDNFEDYKPNAFNVLHLCEEMDLFDNNEKLIKILREVYENTLIEDSGFWIFGRIIEKYKLADDLVDLIVKEFKKEELFSTYQSSFAECLFGFTKSENIKEINDIVLNEENTNSYRQIELLRNDKLSDFVENLARIYNEQPNEKLFHEVVRFATILEKHVYTNDTITVCNFFVLINEVEKFYHYVNSFVREFVDSPFTIFGLLALPSDEVVKLCAKDFIEGKLDNKYLFYYRNILSEPQKQLFTDLINKGLEKFFDNADKEYNRQVAIIENYTKKQFEMLVDSKLMIEELEHVFQLAYENRKNKNLETITRNDLYEKKDKKKSLGIDQPSLWVDVFGIRILGKYVFQNADNFPINKDGLERRLCNWDEAHKKFIGLNELVENYNVDKHQQYKEVLLPQIQAWVDKNAPLLDLESAKMYYNGVAKVIKELHKKGLAIISDDTLLNLLQFDTVEIEYYKKIAETVGLEAVITRIRENLSNPTRKAKMLSFNLVFLGGNYASFLRETITDKLTQVEFATLLYEWLLATKNKEHNYFTLSCVKTIIAFQPNDNKILENLLEEMVIEDDFLYVEAKRMLIEELVKRKSIKVKNYLSDIFKPDTITDLENFRVASQLAFLGEKSAWEYIVNNLQDYQQTISQRYDAFWFITNFDFTNGKFIEYLQKMFSDLISRGNYVGVYDKYLSVYLTYANTNKENYEIILTHLNQELAKDNNQNLKNFHQTFQRQYTEKQVVNRAIEKILAIF